MQTMGKGSIQPTPLEEIFKAHYGEKEYNKRLQRAKKYNEENNTGIDIDKVMKSPVVLVKHNPYVRTEEGQTYREPEGYFTQDTVQIRNPITTELKDEYEGNIISISRMFDLASETARNEFAPIVIPHEGDHAQYSESGLSMSTKAPSWMGENLTPSGNKLTEIHAYGKNIVDLLNRYLPEDQQIDPGEFSDPVQEIPKLADRAIIALKKDLETAEEGRKGLIEDHVAFIEWARKPFDAFTKKEKLPHHKIWKNRLKNTLNEAFKGLVTIEDNRYVIQKA